MAEAVASWFVSNVVGISGAAALGAAGVTAVSLAVQVVVSAAASTLIGKVLGPSERSTGALEPQRMNTTVRQSAAPRRLIYGECKVGGILVYPAQSPDGLYVHLATYLGEGPIAAVDPVYWVGEDLSTEGKFAGLLQMVPYLGAPGQVASAELIAASGGEWTADHVGTGCAWVHTRFAFDRNAFPQGLVFPAFMVRGRTLYDPRTGGAAWSSNPALCLLDFIRSEYGYAAPDAWIDFDSFAAAAAVCDEVLASIDAENVVDGVPYRVRRYSCNGVFEVGANPASIVSALEACCAGKLVFSGGRYRFYAGAWRAPTGPTLTAEYLRGDPSYRTHAGRQQRLNISRGTYREPRQDWQEFDFREQRLDEAVIAEDGEIVQAVRLPAVTNGAQAQRLGRLQMMLARSAVPLVLQCNYAAFVWRLYDTVTVALPEVGAVGTFLITDYAFPEGGGIAMSLVPHRAEDFAWVPELHEQLVPDVVRPDFNTTPAPVSDLVGSGAPAYTYDDFRPQLSATWSAVDDVLRRAFEVQWRLSSSPDWTSGMSVTLPSWSTQAVVATQDYDIRVRVVRNDGTTSGWVEVLAVTVAEDDIAPGPPGGLSVTGTSTHTIHWTNDEATDLKGARIYENTVLDLGTATLLATDIGLPGAARSYINAAGGERFYWISCFDRSGNESARTYAGTAT